MEEESHSGVGMHLGKRESVSLFHCRNQVGYWGIKIWVIVLVRQYLYSAAFKTWDFCMIWISILLDSVWYYHFHFTSEETEAQRVWVICPSHVVEIWGQFFFFFFLWFWRLNTAAVQSQRLFPLLWGICVEFWVILLESVLVFSPPLCVSVCVCSINSLIFLTLIAKIH